MTTAQKLELERVSLEEDLTWELYLTCCNSPGSTAEERKYRFGHFIEAMNKQLELQRKYTHKSEPIK